MSDVESAKYWLSWLEFGGKVAILLVVIGVAYEFVEKRFGAPLQKIIDDAREAELKTVNERLSSANIEIARLSNEASQANARAAEANKAAEEDRLARLQIEQRLAHRVVTKEIHDKAVALLAQNPGTVEIVADIDDGETKEFATGVISALQDASWNVQVQYISLAVPRPENLFAAINDSTEAGKALVQFLYLLPGDKILSSRIPLSNDGRITIGPKSAP